MIIDKVVLFRETYNVSYLSIIDSDISFDFREYLSGKDYLYIIKGLDFEIFQKFKDIENSGYKSIRFEALNLHLYYKGTVIEYIFTKDNKLKEPYIDIPIILVEVNKDGFITSGISFKKLKYFYKSMKVLKIGIFRLISENIIFIRNIRLKRLGVLSDMICSSKLPSYLAVIEEIKEWVNFSLFTHFLKINK